MYTETQMLKIPPKIMAHRHRESGNKGNSQYGQDFHLSASPLDFNFMPFYPFKNAADATHR